MNLDTFRREQKGPIRTFLKLLKIDVERADEEEKRRVGDLRKKALFLGEAERQFFSQKLKTKHLICADRGTSYFHGVINKRKSANLIVAIMNSSGSLTTSSKQVGDLFVEYYTGLFVSAKVSWN